MVHHGGGGGGSEGAGVGGGGVGRGAPWVTGTHQQYAAEHLEPRPAALGALEAAAISYTGLTALVSSELPP